ncbi:MAG: MoxR family ATPase [Oscillospiraceae bacterium]|nr:MoxR family ATPase [Oscillospiraceae bacterium]
MANETEFTKIDRTDRIDKNDFIAAYSTVQKISDQTEQIILGKKDVVKMTVISLLSQGHILIEDVPGVGKTTLASALSKIIGLKYKRAQFTPDVMPSDITGFSIYNKVTNELEYKEGLALCNILLADEINRTSPKTQSSLLEVMEEGTITVDGKTHRVPTPFMVIATQNPIGFVGTHPLPEAQLDRFIMRISIGYPDVENEIRIISDRKTENPIDRIQTLTSADDIIHAQNIVKNVHIDDTLYKYIVELVAKTRNHQYITLGASPRASLSLMRLSQARAFLEKRDYIIPEDILNMYVPAIAHRIILKQEAKLKRINTEDILNEIKKSVAPQILNEKVKKQNTI